MDPNIITERKFKEVFCEYYGCSEERFATKVYWKCIRGRGYFFSVILFPFRSRIIAEALEAIEAIGKTASGSDADACFARYYGKLKLQHPFLISRLNLRISSRKLQELRNRIYSGKGAADKNRALPTQNQ
jgi:hypothetical protein